MSLEYDDEETDRPLAASDDINLVGESQPRTSSELLGAAEISALEAVNSTAGMAPREGSDEELRREELEHLPRALSRYFRWAVQQTYSIEASGGHLHAWRSLLLL